jgi:1-acyl-sn-glycerol-3-phosphate acyltransferase
MRMFYRLAVLGGVVVALMPLQWLAMRFGWRLRDRIPVLFHRTALRVIDVRVHVAGQPSQAMRPLLFVSNHNSWLDIPVLGSIEPLVFVAKSEIASWPLFGTFARMQRSVFVDRNRRQVTGDVNRSIASRLSGGDPVVLFGEGTSSDGNRILPFRSALLGALRDSMKSDGESFVQPVSISYTRFHGIPMGRQHRDVAAWCGDMELVPHLLQVLREGAIDVVVTFGEPISVRQEDDRKALSRKLESLVRAQNGSALTGRQPPSPLPVSMAAETR